VRKNWVSSSTLHRRGIKGWGIKFILKHNQWGTFQFILSWGNHFKSLHEEDVIQRLPTAFHVYQWLNKIHELKHSYRPVNEKNDGISSMLYWKANNALYGNIFGIYPHYVKLKLFSLFSDKTNLLSTYFVRLLKFKNVL
jgi:hypothetical protein